MITVVIVDDNDVIRLGLRSLFEASGTVRVVGEAATGDAAIAVVRETRPQVTLLDVRMPGKSGIDVVGTLRDLTAVLMLTYSDEDEIVAAAIREGARGYLVHGSFAPDEVIAAVEQVAGGGHALSPSVTPALFGAVREGTVSSPPLAPHDVRSRVTNREGEILDLIARGLSNADIAAELFVDEKTVKNHINRAYAKLHARNRGEAIATWLGTRRAGG